jgi:AraC-like DNA-binding protein
MPQPGEERVKEIQAYIHEHYANKITADGIARHLDVSRGECFRCFKKHMGKSLVEYINEVRLHKAAGLLKETEMSAIDISLECGFENASYFGKIFKELYSQAPAQYRKSHIWTKNSIQRINGYDYEYYKDTGDGTMTITGTRDNGSFLCDWTSYINNNALFRGGRKFHSRDKTRSQIGRISLEYDAEYNTNGCTYLCVYGWTVEPLVEWYIVEHYTTYKPVYTQPRSGTLDADSGCYEIYRTTQVNKPSILGTEDTFEQYWSIRKSCRTCGTIDVSAHFRAWEDLGLRLGNLSEVSLSIEGWRSSGNAAVRKNVLTIGGG